MVLDPFGEIVWWNHIAFSILFAAIFIRDLIDHPDNQYRKVSNYIALGACGLLMVNGLFQPEGVIIMAVTMVMFTGALVMQLVPETWRRLNRA